MNLQLKRIDKNNVMTPANFGIKKGIDRKVVYYLMKEDKIDYTEIDGVMFVVLNAKTKKYKKSR